MKKNNFITAEKIYDEVWKCRNFEIKNLWQRSIFLTAFIIMIFTAYGTFFTMIIKQALDAKTQEKLCVEILLKKILCLGWEVQLVFFGISLLGFAFAILWIGMAKGSKYWYELYEKKISFFLEEKNREIFLSEAASNLEKKIKNFLPTQDEIAEFEVKIKDRDKDILSTNAGRFSPSRINILMGQIFLFFWAFLGLAHAGLFIAILCGENIYSLIMRMHVCFYCIVFVCIVFVLFLVLISKLIKSMQGQT